MTSVVPEGSTGTGGKIGSLPVVASVGKLEDAEECSGMSATVIRFRLGWLDGGSVVALSWAKRSTSLAVTLPPRPVPKTRLMSTPSCLAMPRTAGVASALACSVGTSSASVLRRVKADGASPSLFMLPTTVPASSRSSLAELSVAWVWSEAGLAGGWPVLSP